MSKPIQQQVARLVWHANYSLKRSFSAVTNAAANAMPTPNPNYSGQGSLNKNWIHPPDALIYGRVEYTVKLLGDVPVDQAKGTEVIKGAIQVLRFNLSVKKSTGFKLQKVELHINVDGVNIVDAKTKMVLHKYPLHRISFCADDKNDKRLFAFIARQQSSLPNTDAAAIGCGSNAAAEHGAGQRHHCYVFLSDKLAEEITVRLRLVQHRTPEDPVSVRIRPEQVSYSLQIRALVIRDPFHTRTPDIALSTLIPLLFSSPSARLSI